ncbi:MAG TPA: response regulator [Candidatus Dormibacteraeota bacterium]|jgi:pilus assembly protein CpaE|nr:response regulator [Candidatus Dormibacteraeota bacterium]
MAGERIRVLIVDDHDATVQTVTTMLQLDREFEVVGAAGDGKAAIEAVERLEPHVVLMDINMPVMDGIAATEAIVHRFSGTAVVMLSAQTDHEYLRRSMNVGASYFLAKPVSSDELYNAIRRAHEVNQLRSARYAPPAEPTAADAPRPAGSAIAFFSPSGGVGRTTIVTNLAVALQRSAPTLIVDLSLPFGDVSVLLNAPPKARSIGDLIGRFATMREADLDQVLFTHRSGVRALLAPPSPEVEERIGPDDVRKVLDVARASFRYVLVDTWASYGETMLAVLDSVDAIVLPLTLELTSVKNARVFVELMGKLGLNDKVAFLVNRFDQPNALKLNDVEAGLGRKVAFNLSTDESSLRLAMNRGLPVIDTHPDSKLSREFLALAKVLTGETPLAKERQLSQLIPVGGSTEAPDPRDRTRR